MIAVVKAVADAPPPAFSGGGKWEAMHGDMNGFYEIRADGPKRHHYRLFCMLEREGAKLGLGGNLGREYLARNPRSVEQ